MVLVGDLLKAQCGQWQGKTSQITYLLTDQREQAAKDTERKTKLDAALAARATQPGVMEMIGKLVGGVQHSWKNQSTT